MKQNYFFLITFLSFTFFQGQNTANRFFYELTYKSYIKDSIVTKKTLTILDITNQKSIYRDYLSVSQDSLITELSEKYKKSGNNVDMQKLIKTPNFTHKIIKEYPIKKVTYYDKVLQDNFIYEEAPNLQWKILKEKKTIGEYKAQKATAKYGGKNWIAWFSNDIPFLDGPYKFYGLPGLIVQIEDEEDNISWTLAGNKTVKNYKEKSLLDGGNNIKSIMVSKEKFKEIDTDYRNNPMGRIKATVPAEKLTQQMPDGKTLEQKIKEQEEQMKTMLKETTIKIEE